MKSTGGEEEEKEKEEGRDALSQPGGAEEATVGDACEFGVTCELELASVRISSGARERKTNRGARTRTDRRG